ncbi:hypothetical protein BCR33DRAFT_715271 [Rhizoclosmatium globosum]|uniref:UDP-galactose transporter homolog 1 n=1 Tax=Rhizoclosmatium globosum TaxID=329046 RepID=A0A1Y2CIK4_9FUNG|nr:hypothetical protein BCR33DRAFT_715271 [Rhizoclosmatium globosum]|eukprot:ORY46852.1 hypothetical protein BCR33DRAFT_715271 [Rhizoclosmatium globosum]
MSLIAVIVSYCFLRGQKNPCHIPVVSPIILTVCYMLGVYAGPIANQYTSRSVVMTAEALLIIPVILIGFFNYKKTYPWQSVLAGALITTGVVAFILDNPSRYSVQSKTYSSFPPTISTDTTRNIFGVLFLVVSLVSKATVFTLQESLLTSGRANPLQLIFYVNLFILLTFGASTIFSSDFAVVAEVMSRHSATVTDLIGIGVCWTLKQYTMLIILERFGAASYVIFTLPQTMFSVVLWGIRHKEMSMLWNTAVPIVLVDSGCVVEGVAIAQEVVGEVDDSDKTPEDKKPLLQLSDEEEIPEPKPRKHHYPLKRAALLLFCACLLYVPIVERRRWPSRYSAHVGMSHNPKVVAVPQATRNM